MVKNLVCPICYSFTLCNHQNIVKDLRKRIQKHIHNKNDTEAEIARLYTHKKCYICNKTPLILEDSLTKDAIVEHYHEGGTIRGLSCRSCNVIEGKIKKDIEKYNTTYNDLLKKYDNDIVHRLNDYYRYGGGILPMESHDDDDKEKSPHILKKRKFEKMDWDYDC
jgi:hypothetical protein